MARKHVAIIGGGAAGFFTAINLAEQCSQVTITIYEASQKLLAKVLISGGGRCNVTNTISKPYELVKNYPRGNKWLKPAFSKFTTQDTQQWFIERGVALKTEEDGRVFPVSNSSQTIYDLFLSLCRKYGIRIEKQHRLQDLSYEENQWSLAFNSSKTTADYVVLATGSNKKVYSLLQQKGLTIVPDVPSLFTFQVKPHKLLHLSGISLPKASVVLQQQKDTISLGPLLITHKGYSGPAVLKFSAWQARTLNGLNYTFEAAINWNTEWSANQLEEAFTDRSQHNAKERVTAANLMQLPKRLWQQLLEEAEINPYTNWAELGKKKRTKLIQLLTSYPIEVVGKNTFKEEFVTAGGIDLSEMDKHTFAITKWKNCYAAGELLNIDGVTGGFNFQAAWTAGFLIAKDLKEHLVAEN
jgi:predicted Rossmann fold flavoprotein